MTKPLPIKLHELTGRIKKTLTESFAVPIWVIAEINELRVNQSGHCYLELIEKDPDSEKLLSSVKAIIWSFHYRILQPYFETATGISLGPGIKIMVLVKVEYHPIYGLSLNITDIDPAYTLGDFEMKRQLIVKKLADEGIIHLNRELELPPVCQRIAVISAENAAGYGDFINQLKNNPFKYKFYIHLFPAFMQGDNAEESITRALDRINTHTDIFDVVVIIRGGGARTDLSCFDSYWIASNIAQFPLPVITGIGHERDETIADMVANQSLKTPTAVAEFFIQHNYRFQSEMVEYYNRTKLVFDETIKQYHYELDVLSKILVPKLKNYISNNRNKLDIEILSVKNLAYAKIAQNQHIIKEKLTEVKRLTAKNVLKAGQKSLLQQSRLKSSLKKYFTQKSHYLSMANRAALLQDPANIIGKGYSVLFKDGKMVRSVNGIHIGDNITNMLKDGEINSSVV